MKSLITIYLHSISDVITNSSSEIFCRVKALDDDTCFNIDNLLSFILGTDSNGEYRPYYEYGKDEYGDDKDDTFCIYITYAAKDLSDAYKEFILKCLDTVVDRKNYEIRWE